MTRKTTATAALLRGGLLCAIVAVCAVIGTWLVPGLAESSVSVPAPLEDVPARGAQSETAVFAGGCFWGVQGVFQHVKGVTSAISGYAGGSAEDARYAAVSSGTTGHAEAVSVTFDPRVISYGRLLQIFFAVAHDPTQWNRQGPDTGPQYRSAVFPLSDDQARVARRYIAQIDRTRVFGKHIETRIESLPAFYRAEPDHQDYLADNPDDRYIVVNDLPRIARLKREFPGDYRAQPVLVKGSARPR